MRPSEALEKYRDEVRAIVRECGAEKPRLFGSVARGDDHGDSDVDILVDLPDGVPYRQLFRIEDALGAILGRKVDV